MLIRIHEPGSAGGRPESAREIDLDNESVLGRRQDCDIVIADTAVSGRHILIRPDGGALYFRDLGSTNGTSVDGRRVESGVCPLGSEILIGDTSIRIVASGAEPVAAPKPEALADLSILLKLAATTAGDFKDFIESALYRCSLLLAEETDYEIFCGKTLDILADELADVSSAVVIEWDEAGVPGVIAAVSRGSEPTLSRSIVRKVREERRVLLISDSSAGPGSASASSESILASGIRSLIAAPIFSRGEPAGILQIEAPSLPFGEKELRGVSAIANLISASKESAAARRTARALEREKAILARYLSHDVVDRVLSGKDSLRLGGDTRTVTVFFSDIRGYTSLSESLAPEELVRILNRFFGRIAQQIFEYGGTVDKFIGDAVMAVFGAPYPALDDAARACRMALAVREIVREIAGEIRSETGLEVGMGFGLSSGKVISGNIGWQHRMEYTSIGDPVNLASRLTGEAAAGEILADRETVALAGNVNARLRGTVPIKGKREPVEVMEILGLGSQC